MIALTAEEALVPAAAGFHVGYGDERLWAHLGAVIDPEYYLAGQKSQYCRNENSIWFILF
jgi:hypothetical protein